METAARDASSLWIASGSSSEVNRIQSEKSNVPKSPISCVTSQNSEKAIDVVVVTCQANAALEIQFAMLIRKFATSLKFAGLRRKFLELGCVICKWRKLKIMCH